MNSHPQKHPNIFVTLYWKYRCKDKSELDSNFFMSPLRHHLSDNKLTELMHITRAQTDLKSPVTVVEQDRILEEKKDKPLRTMNPFLQESTGQAGSIIHFMLFYKAWNTQLTETFYFHHTMRCPETPRTMAEPVFLTVKLGHNPRICHKQLKAEYFYYSQVFCPFSLPQLNWQELQLHFLMAKMPASHSWKVTELWLPETWRNTSFDTN